jgi:hypothetical protein
MYARHILRRRKIGKTANRARFGEKKDAGYWMLAAAASIENPASNILFPAYLCRKLRS